MTGDTFVRGLLPQLRAVGQLGEFTFVSRLRLIVGARHGLSAAEIVTQLEAAFAAGQCGDAFDDVCLDVVITQPGDELPAPGRSDTMTATGWELLVANIEGRRADDDE
jgi:hypothetical protein